MKIRKEEKDGQIWSETRRVEREKEQGRQKWRDGGRGRDREGREGEIEGRRMKS